MKKNNEEKGVKRITPVRIITISPGFVSSTEAAEAYPLIGFGDSDGKYLLMCLDDLYFGFVNIDNPCSYYPLFKALTKEEAIDKAYSRLKTIGLYGSLTLKDLIDVIEKELGIREEKEDE